MMHALCAADVGLQTLEYRDKDENAERMTFPSIICAVVTTYNRSLQNYTLLGFEEVSLLQMINRDGPRVL